MNFLQTVLAFILCLGPLIVFHELGHYLVARWCGVKVLRFSVGMGKVVWSRRVGPDQTEWAISALPLGGYVKMLDGREADLSGLPPEDLKREFTRQNVWRRIAIVAAGPLANFLIAILLFTGLYMHGVEEPSSKITVRGIAAAVADDAPAIATPAEAQAAEATPAWQAGLRSGDTVSAVNEQPVAVWSELRWDLVQAAMDKTAARVTVERPGQGTYHFVLPAATLAALDLEGDVLGKLGLDLARPAPVVQEVPAGGVAANAGLRVGDLLLSVDGRAVGDGIAFIDMIRAAPGRPVKIALRRDGQTIELTMTPEPTPANANASAGANDKPGKGTVTVGKIGAVIALRPDMINQPSSPIAAVGKAGARVWETCSMTLKMIGRMITGEVSLKHVTGPIAIADYAGQTARMGLASYLGFIAFVSISLGVMNLLPIPVLDGGHLLYYSLEVLTGRSVPERFGEIAQRLGIGLLLALMLLAVFNDVSQRL